LVSTARDKPPVVADRSRNQTSAPLLNDENTFKLAVFGVNVSGGCAMTTADGTIQVDWAESRRIAKAADAAALDALVPVARWKGAGGLTNFNDRSFETFTWAAAVAAVTDRLQPMATIHVPTAHPLRVAKEAATIDHISGGRFGLNIVAGWNEPEFAMFGIEQKHHDERYAVAAEWATVVHRLWAEDTFDFNGDFYRGTALHSLPKPVQSPGPLIMSASASPAGQEFAAANADINFITAADLEAHGEKAAFVRALAKDTFGREVSVMGMGYVVCADTEKEARRFRDHYVNDKGDWACAAAMIKVGENNVESVDVRTRGVMAGLIAGYNAMPLVGTPEQIVDGMLAMSKVGLDGCTLSWVDYELGISQYAEQIHPLLVEAGLRAARLPA
jgi:FMNH2-dependent dimethyl sulfone monooxygenase